MPILLWYFPFTMFCSGFDLAFRTGETLCHWPKSPENRKVHERLMYSRIASASAWIS